MNDRAAPKPRGDQVRVTMAVAVPQEVAFEIFTNEIDRWWRKGPRFRECRHERRNDPPRSRASAGDCSSRWKAPASNASSWWAACARGSRPRAWSFTWKNEVFAANEDTEVEVTFAPTARGTLVTVTHRGWAAIRPDHPARHSMPVDEFIRSLGGWWGDQMSSMRLLIEAAAPEVS